MQQRVLNLRRSLSTNHLHPYRTMELSTQALLLPSLVDRRSLQSPVWDQGNSGSCSAFSSKSHLEDLQLAEIRDTTPNIDPLEWIKDKFTPISAYFHYWNTRALEGSTATDAGATTLVDVATALRTKGAVSEATWPATPQNLLKCPPSTAYGEAWHHKLPLHYVLDQNLAEMKRCLNNGFGFVFGVLVYGSFMEAGNGHIPTPNPFRENLEGGHALYMVGYDDARQCFIFKNSWSTQWGMQGYGYIPYNYILDPRLAFDFITFRLVPTANP